MSATFRENRSHPDSVPMTTKVRDVLDRVELEVGYCRRMNVSPVEMFCQFRMTFYFDSSGWFHGFLAANNVFHAGNFIGKLFRY